MRNRERESHRRPNASSERYSFHQSDPRHPLAETVGTFASETLVYDDRTGEEGINADAPDSALQRSVHSRRRANDRHLQAADARKRERNARHAAEQRRFTQVTKEYRVCTERINDSLGGPRNTGCRREDTDPCTPRQYPEFALW